MDDMGTSQKWSSFFSSDATDFSWPDSIFSDQFDPIAFNRNDDQDDKLYPHGLEGIGKPSCVSSSPAVEKVSAITVPSASSSSSEDTTRPGNPTGASVKFTAGAPT